MAGDICGALNTQTVMGFSYQCDACSNYHKDKWARQIGRGGGGSLRWRRKKVWREAVKRGNMEKRKMGICKGWRDNGTKKWCESGSDGVGKVAFRNWWKDHFLSIHNVTVSHPLELLNIAPSPTAHAGCFSSHSFSSTQTMSNRGCATEGNGEK